MGDFFDTAWFVCRMHFAGAWKTYIGIIAAVAVVGLAWYSLFAPPNPFVTGLAAVPSGEPLSSVGAALAQDGIIRSPFIFKLTEYAIGHSRDIQAGEYEFTKRENVFAVAWRIAHGETGIVPIRVTFTEGMASFDMARVLAKDIPGFDSAGFQTLAAQHEGYLFPDTYFLLPTMTPQDVITTMTQNFNTRIASITPEIEASGHSLSDVVTVASIVEREAQTPEDRRLVAGILWHRLAVGMRLEVDPPFGYVHQDDGYVPTPAEIATPSPYNTYRNDGLPPTPISNPGLDALEAAANPTQSDYLYYIAGSDGTMHYAKTFAQHEANIQAYL